MPPTAPPSRSDARPGADAGADTGDADAGPGDADPHVARIAVHPIKSLDPVERRRSRLVEGGGLAGDREYAVVDADGEYVNGKRTDAVHRIRAAFADDLSAVELRRRDDPEGTARRFPLGEAAVGYGTAGGEGATGEGPPGEGPTDDGDGAGPGGERSALADWLSEQFGRPVRVKRDAAGGFPDDTALSGPTVVSTATLREVASWYDGIDLAGMRLLVRANVEVGGVPPFWEDRLYGDEDQEVAVRVGEATLRGASPCRRCVVPTRDLHTGEKREGFVETFVERRRETLPEWADRSRFEEGGYFRLAVNTRVPRYEAGSELTVGDPVTVLGERPRIGAGG